MRVFSGIQATGAKHIGNYIGAMRQYVTTQEEGDAFFCIVDLHSVTVDYDPQDLARPLARPGRAAVRGRPRPRPLDAVPAEPRDGACRRRLGCSRPSPGSDNSAA